MIKSKSVRAPRLKLAAGAMAALVMGGGLLASTAMAQQPKSVSGSVTAGKPIVVSPPAGAPMSFADLIDRVSPAVVSVQVTTEIKKADIEKRFGPFRKLPGLEDDKKGADEDNNGDDPSASGDDQETDEEGNALGSGFFISPNGYIVTNNHVVEDAREVTVVLKGGEELEAEIVGTDEQTDLAVLKVKKSGSYPYVELSKSKPRVGDWVVAVGNPFGLGGTATAGIVSADARKLNGSGYNEFIQVDAPINKGNSGGPTFNLNGEVIGVNTAIFSNIGGGSVGIGFAIEAGTVKKISDTLIKNGKVVRGYLGVEIQNLDQRFAEAYGLKDVKGAIVSRVTKDGPADVAGIKLEDIIVSVNGDKVDDNRELTQRVGSLIAGSRNSFKIIRKGQEQTIWVTVKERSNDLGKPTPASLNANIPTAPKSMPDDSKLLGGTVRPLSSQEMTKFELAAPNSGLLVVTTEKKGALATAEPIIIPGDALLSANGKALKTVKDLEDAVTAAKTAHKEHISILVGCGDPREQCTTLLHAVKVD